MSNANWTAALRERVVHTVPPGEALPDKQPAYVSSWIYVFGVLTLSALAVVIGSGTVLAIGGAGWWHTSGFAHFINSVHLWSVELFFAFMVIHLWGQFWMAAWRGRRALTWMSGVLCFLGSIGTAFTGYLSQSNLDSQWISTQAKDGLNAVGIGAWFNVLNPGQMLLWHVMLLPAVVIALVVVLVLSVGLAAMFSSPDERPITLSRWATAAPNDVVATATGELAGTTASAGYGPPYNSAASGQQLGPLKLQKWAGVRIPVDSAALVLDPLAGNSGITAQLAIYRTAGPKQQVAWATAYGDALAKAPGGDPAKVATGDYGPVPALAGAFLGMARAGGIEGSLSSSGNFYGGDQTRTLLLLSDGAYLEDQARARSLGGDQWGMMNETGNYPGQPWMWLYTFWYQVQPFSTSANADAQVWALMMLLTLVLLLVPFLPGIRSVPRLLPVHRLIWRDYYRKHPRPTHSS